MVRYATALTAGTVQVPTDVRQVVVHGFPTSETQDGLHDSRNAVWDIHITFLLLVGS